MRRATRKLIHRWHTPIFSAWYPPPGLLQQRVARCCYIGSSPVSLHVPLSRPFPHEDCWCVGSTTIRAGDAPTATRRRAAARTRVFGLSWRSFTSSRPTSKYHRHCGRPEVEPPRPCTATSSTRRESSALDRAMHREITDAASREQAVTSASCAGTHDRKSAQRRFPRHRPADCPV